MGDNCPAACVTKVAAPFPMGDSAATFIIGAALRLTNVVPQLYNNTKKRDTVELVLVKMEVFPMGNWDAMQGIRWPSAGDATGIIRPRDPAQIWGDAYGA